jgi:glycerol-3-phosphate dehydrogenase (NAD(P)+)
MRVAIIGGGGWGLALSKLLAENTHDVLVWEFNPAYLDTLTKTHTNPALLPDINLPDNILFTGDFHAVAEFAPHLVLLAVPSQYLRGTLSGIPAQAQTGIWDPSRLLAVVNVAKGIEEDSLLTMSSVLRELLPPTVHGRVCTLSGPSHAEEVARRIPTTVVVAGSDESLLKELQSIFSNNYFRCYRSLDLVGVEMGGAIKNVIAIAAGIVAGLGFGDNTIGALLTRGLVEIQRLGVACGAKAETFLGLSGVGDLITTATSGHSRNRFVGFEIGSGKKLNDIISSMKMVAEGVVTTKSVHDLAGKMGVDMPITEQVFQALYQDKDPRQAILELMTRELKPE